MSGPPPRFALSALFMLPVLAAASCESSPKTVHESSAPVPLPAEKEPREADFFPPEGIDHLAMKVAVTVDVFGIGKDSFDLEGSAAVHRSGPLGDSGRSMWGDLIAATFRGKSVVFGEVVAFESPLARSPCEYVYKAPGQYHGRFDLNGWFWLPEHDLFLYSGLPVRVAGTAGAIPPVGQKAVLENGDVPLHDLRKRDGKAVGILTRASAEIQALVRVEEHLRGPELRLPAVQASP